MEAKENKIKQITDYSKKNYKIIALYFLLFFGGLWHILGVFQTLTDIFAQYLIILISIFTFFEYFNIQTKEKKAFLSYSIIIILAGFCIELIGHDTGYIFGEYQYGPILNIKLGGVPIAIGFAWLSTLLSSLALFQRTKIYLMFSGRNLLKSIFVGAFMMVFDAFMEPAAIKLDYWTWDIGIVPLQNYLAWFIFGSIFAYIGFRMKVFFKTAPKFAIHVYTAQLIYFIMVYFA